MTAAGRRDALIGPDDYGVLFLAVQHYYECHETPAMSAEMLADLRRLTYLFRDAMLVEAAAGEGKAG